MGLKSDIELGFGILGTNVIAVAFNTPTSSLVEKKYLIAAVKSFPTIFQTILKKQAV